MAEIKNKATLDTTQFQAGLAGMSSKVKGLGQSLKSMPGIGQALSVGAVAAFAKAALSSADQIDNLANQMNMGVEAVQAYQVALGEAGLSMGELQATSMKLNKAQADALNGNAQAAESFAALGIDMKSLKGADPTRMLELVGQGLARTDGQTEATAASFRLLGESSGKLKQVLMDLNRDGIQSTINAYKEMGLVIDAETVARLDAAEQRLSRFGAATKNFGTQALADIMRGIEMTGARLGGAESWTEAAGLVDEPQRIAAQAKEEKRAREQAAQLASVEAATNKELSALEEKRRIQGLTSEALKAELQAKLAIAQADLQAAQNAAQKVEALKQIMTLEDGISRIKTDSAVSDSEEDSRVSSFTRIGGGMGGRMDWAQHNQIGSPSNMQRRQEEASRLQKATVDAVRRSNDILERIANREGGAIL
jgi:hypothetical protein